ncbi:enoyl-CoA hydratase/isomerase family protein [Actinoplanes philippinensis]|uniref:enoyl-CoA hydratase/isomerase family protein n=1 Tax=Actinoplanes philippinensis TaxID=35752 RepID=UPI0033C3ADFF
MSDPSAPPVLAEVTGGLGRLTLNRPAAINALTAEMVGTLRRTLADWTKTDRVRAVLISGAGPRGLCAGGDLRAMHADAVSGGAGTLDFWADEYRLNAELAAYPKPVVAFMDGLVMGGGIGVSAHASLRVVTERSRLAMPEVGIGFHPDVGGSWLLARAPGQIGVHLALTGATIGAPDAILAGLADVFVPSARLDDLATALQTGDAAEVVASFAGPLPPGHPAAETSPATAAPSGATSPGAGAAPPGAGAAPPGAGAALPGAGAALPGAGATSPGAGAAPPGDLAAARHWIDECYIGDDVAAIVDRLASSSAAGAQAAAKEIATKSPTSLVVALRSVRSAAAMSGLREALDQEYRLSAALLRLPDLAEGIRAQIIDKDRRPRWQPATLAEVSPAVIDACFAPPATR